MAEYRTQPNRAGGTPPARRRRRRRRRRRAPIFLLLGLLLLIAVGLVAGIRIFFNIGTIDVTGDKLYPAQQVIDASGIRTGQNLLTVSPKKTAARICAALPMVLSAQVELRPTSRVVIVLHADTRAGFIKWNGKDVVVDSEMKILETQLSPSGEKGLPEIKGVTLSTGTPGTNLAPPSQAAGGSSAASGSAVQPGAVSAGSSSPAAEAVSAEAASAATAAAAAAQVQRSLRSNGFALTDVVAVDVSDIYEITVNYQNRVSILVGTTSDLDYKLRMAKTIIDKQLAKADRGQLDVSNVGSNDSADADRVYFEPK